MKEDDVQLIHRVLSGDDGAFSALVGKYRKSVHALAWRKVGDFHFAEEITQDTFLQAYKKLSTLRNPNQFAGWLYVIADRLCKNWHRRSKLVAMQSLENTNHSEIDAFSYKCYESEQRESAVSEHRREIVRNLLKKLPKSERTVVVLYYFGEMTVKEIGKFLGVSVNTIKSRLRRARKRLQSQKEELLVSETLGSIQLPAELTENIMRQIADMKPTPTPVAKPLLPWAAIGATALVLMLLIGIGNQFLTRFQQPYSFEAQSEPKIELIDAPITLEILSKPAIRRQIGRAPTSSKRVGAGLQVSEVGVAHAADADFPDQFSTAQWTQMGGPQGGLAHDIFGTSEGTLYARSQIGIYKLPVGATTWTPLNIDIPIELWGVPMTEHAGTLYIVRGDEILASIDGGETWNALGTRPAGNPNKLIVVDAAAGRNARASVTMYLALWDSGIFRSTDAGKHWTPVNNGLTDRKVHKLAAIEDTVFASTDRGLYRLNSDIWEQLPIDTSRTIHALAVFEDNLYIGTGPSVQRIMHVDGSRTGRILRSSDLGASWTEITPKNELGLFALPTGRGLLGCVYI